MTLLTPEGRARATLAQGPRLIEGQGSSLSPGAGEEPGLLKGQQTSKRLPMRLKDAAIVSVVKASERFWMDVFKECDVDDDDSITRRELLVLMKRLNLEIPGQEELLQLISDSDFDEDGKLSFVEFTALIRKLGVSRTVDVVGSLEGGLRSAVRSYVKEKRGVVLWRDVFNRLDRFPRDGMIDAFELQQAILASRP